MRTFSDGGPPVSPGYEYPLPFDWISPRHVFDHLKSILPATACTSIIVSAKIRFGLCKGVSEKLKIQAEKVLEVFCDDPVMLYQYLDVD